MTKTLSPVDKILLLSPFEVHVVAATARFEDVDVGADNDCGSVAVFQHGGILHCTLLAPLPGSLGCAYAR